MIKYIGYFFQANNVASNFVTLTNLCLPGTVYRMCCIVLGQGGSQGGPPRGSRGPPGAGGQSGLCYFERGSVVNVMMDIK